MYFITIFRKMQILKYFSLSKNPPNEDFLKFQIIANQK